MSSSVVNADHAPTAADPQDVESCSGKCSSQCPLIQSSNERLGLMCNLDSIRTPDTCETHPRIHLSRRTHRPSLLQSSSPDGASRFIPDLGRERPLRLGKRSHARLLVHLLLAHGSLVYRILICATLALDAAAVPVVGVCPEKVTDSPDKNNAWKDAEDDNEDDGCSGNSALAVGVF
jgi:hypothetical protein